MGLRRRRRPERRLWRRWESPVAHKETAQDRILGCFLCLGEPGTRTRRERGRSPERKETVQLFQFMRTCFCADPDFAIYALFVLNESG